MKKIADGRLIKSNSKYFFHGDQKFFFCAALSSRKLNTMTQVRLVVLNQNSLEM